VKSSGSASSSRTAGALAGSLSAFELSQETILRRRRPG
jgi:hypothetical protein